MIADKPKALCSWPMLDDVLLTAEGEEYVSIRLTADEADALAAQLTAAAAEARRLCDEYNEWCRKDEERMLLERLLGIAYQFDEGGLF